MLPIRTSAILRRLPPRFVLCLYRWMVLSTRLLTNSTLPSRLVVDFEQNLRVFYPNQWFGGLI